MQQVIDVAIVGAGPYGLSLAAHLHAYGVQHRIFGPPMQTWAEHMPSGMLLKSDGFASSLSDPVSAFPLKQFCRVHDLPYHPTCVPVPLDTFVRYGRDFQQRYVPDLDRRLVRNVQRSGALYDLTLADGEHVFARRVVLAVGISHCAHLPQKFASLPAHLVSHSSTHKDPSRWVGRSVAVLGAGASAIDLAALLHEAGAKVCILTRHAQLVFHRPPRPGPRSLWQRLRYPYSGLGLGWPSRIYADFPLLFRFLPLGLRQKIVRKHLGPSGGWPMRERVTGKFPVHTGIGDLTARPEGLSLQLTWGDAQGDHALQVDQLIAATGYRPDVRRLPFLSPELRNQVEAIDGSPVLSPDFESSVPGLYFTGISAALSFGPVMRFAYGSAFTANRLGAHLVDRVGIAEAQPVGAAHRARNNEAPRAAFAETT